MQNSDGIGEKKKTARKTLSLFPRDKNKEFSNSSPENQKEKQN